MASSRWPAGQVGERLALGGIAFCCEQFMLGRGLIVWHVLQLAPVGG